MSRKENNWKAEYKSFRQSLAGEKVKEKKKSKYLLWNKSKEWSSSYILSYTPRN